MERNISDTSNQGLHVRRGFCDVPGGQVHYREAAAQRARPLVLIHASPGSARSLEPLIRAFAPTRRVIAPDTMGNGDSEGAMPAQPEIGFFAERALQAIDTLGIDRFDLYGMHTGGSIAAEIAIQAPGRVRKLILDGIGLYPDALKAALLERYAPAMKPDPHGAHITWAWHFVRDAYMFWPWYATDAAHRRTGGLPAPQVLHDKVVDVLKAIGTYHLSYQAAFRYDKRRRLPLIRVPTMAACAPGDMLARWHDEFAALIPGATKTTTPSATMEPTDAAAVMGRFLDAEI